MSIYGILKYTGLLVIAFHASAGSAFAEDKRPALDPVVGEAISLTWGGLGYHLTSASVDTLRGTNASLKMQVRPSSAAIGLLGAYGVYKGIHRLMFGPESPAVSSAGAKKLPGAAEPRSVLDDPAAPSGSASAKAN